MEADAGELPESSVMEDRGGGVEEDVDDVVVGESPTKLAGNRPAIAPCRNQMDMRKKQGHK